VVSDDDHFSPSSVVILERGGAAFLVVRPKVVVTALISRTPGQPDGEAWFDFWSNIASIVSFSINM
jgi:hypothetical protein